MNIGTLTRSVDDDYPIDVDFSAVDVFVTNNITGAVVAFDAGSATDLTIGSVSFPTANFPTFRISGGTAGILYNLTITATNGAAPPNVLCRSFSIQTEPC